MRSLVFIMFLASCGVPLNVSGSADLNVNIRLEQITEYFRAYYEELYPDDLTEQDQCIKVEVAKFLKMLGEN